MRITPVIQFNKAPEGDDREYIATYVESPNHTYTAAVTKLGSMMVEAFQDDYTWMKEQVEEGQLEDFAGSAAQLAEDLIALDVASKDDMPVDALARLHDGAEGKMMIIDHNGILLNEGDASDISPCAYPLEAQSEYCKAGYTHSAYAIQPGATDSHGFALAHDSYGVLDSNGNYEPRLTVLGEQYRSQN